MLNGTLNPIIPYHTMTATVTLSEYQSRTYQIGLVLELTLHFADTSDSVERESV